jgi:hypothetical protein
MNKLDECDEQIMICASYMSNYYLCEFLEIIDKKFIEKMMSR